MEFLTQSYLDFSKTVPRPLIAVQHYLDALDSAQTISIQLNTDWCHCTPGPEDVAFPKFEV